MLLLIQTYYLKIKFLIESQSLTLLLIFTYFDINVNSWGKMEFKIILNVWVIITHTHSTYIIMYIICIYIV